MLILSSIKRSFLMAFRSSAVITVRPCAVSRILCTTPVLLSVVIPRTSLFMSLDGLIRIPALSRRARLSALQKHSSSQRLKPLSNLLPKFPNYAAFRATPPGCGKRFDQDMSRRVIPYLDPCSFRFALGYCLFKIDLGELLAAQYSEKNYAYL